MAFLIRRPKVSERRACRVVGQHRSTNRNAPVPGVSGHDPWTTRELGYLMDNRLITECSDTRSGRFSLAAWDDFYVVETDAAWSTRHTPPEWFGPWLSGFRHDRGWSLRRAQKAIGVSAGHLCKMENGLRCPSASVAHDIAEAYRMGPNDLRVLLSVARPYVGRDYMHVW